jgi:hypothetical protein
MRNTNKAITHERHILPTIDELIHDLSGSTVYSKLDLRSGYHQLELVPSTQSRISSEFFLDGVTMGDTQEVGVPSIHSMISCSKRLFSSRSTLLRR